MERVKEKTIKKDYLNEYSFTDGALQVNE